MPRGEETTAEGPLPKAQRPCHGGAPAFSPSREGDPHWRGADGQRGPDPPKAEKANGEGSPPPFSAKAQVSRSVSAPRQGILGPQGATPFLSSIICLYSPLDQMPPPPPARALGLFCGQRESKEVGKPSQLRNATGKPRSRLKSPLPPQGNSGHPRLWALPWLSHAMGVDGSEGWAVASSKCRSMDLSSPHPELCGAT